MPDPYTPRAQYDLEQTTVIAPSDGFVVGMTLQKGQRVANIPVRSWMAFVNTAQTTIVVGIDQYVVRHVEPGQSAEVALKMYPSRTFAATVEKIAYITPQGQLQPTGNIALAPTRDLATQPYAVVLRLEDSDIGIGLPGGGAGTAAFLHGFLASKHMSSAE